MNTDVCMRFQPSATFPVLVCDLYSIPDTGKRLTNEVLVHGT